MDSSIYVHRVGCVYHPAQEGSAQPDLAKRLSEVCKGRYRRIDRFTQLSLLGVNDCVRTIKLPVQTALYLASSTGPAENNIRLQKQVIGEGEAPSPVQFINSVTNSASFYLMKEHDLSGQNLFVARHRFSFQAALELASVDLVSARVDIALVGIVDEITHPLAHQKRRLNLSEDATMGEGSHWFLLSKQKSLPFSGTDNEDTSVGVVNEVKLFGNEEGFMRWLVNEKEISHVSFISVTGKEFIGRCLAVLNHGREYVDNNENLWEGKVAGIIGRFLNDDSIENDKDSACGSLLTVCTDTDGRIQITKVCKAGV